MIHVSWRTARAAAVLLIYVLAGVSPSVAEPGKRKPRCIGCDAQSVPAARGVSTPSVQEPFDLFACIRREANHARDSTSAPDPGPEVIPLTDAEWTPGYVSTINPQSVVDLDIAGFGPTGGETSIVIPGHVTRFTADLPEGFQPAFHIGSYADIDGEAVNSGETSELHIHVNSAGVYYLQVDRACEPPFYYRLTPGVSLFFDGASFGRDCDGSVFISKARSIPVPGGRKIIADDGTPPNEAAKAMFGSADLVKTESDLIDTINGYDNERVSLFAHGTSNFRDSKKHGVGAAFTLGLGETYRSTRAGGQPRQNVIDLGSVNSASSRKVSHLYLLACCVGRYIDEWRGGANHLHLMWELALRLGVPVEGWNSNVGIMEPTWLRPDGGLFSNGGWVSGAVKVRAAP
jgi:hypothetical protein